MAMLASQVIAECTPGQAAIRPRHPIPAPRRYSEQSRTKCIGMTIETRPDFCLTPHLSQMLSYGCTRLEIGLQARPWVSRDAAAHGSALPPSSASAAC